SCSPGEVEARRMPLVSVPGALVPSVNVLELAIRGVVIYMALLVALRVFGKREVGQFTMYDLVFILLVANALQPAMTSTDSSLTGGVVLILSLVAANWVVGRLDRLPRIHRLFSAPATVIIRDGKYIQHALDREGLTPDECEMAIREHGLKGIKDVQLGVLEPDGTISVVPTGSKVSRGRHRVRFVRRS
ncbi:MAG TPA: YetF domain-containing protein, partial [Candidatus Udaeobacter sp.]|nr:YetF domain-containing protein [Candidatus Udaeobacter sp.]